MIPKEMIEAADKVLLEWLKEPNIFTRQAMVKAALAAALSVQWRGMESAPKDGTWILVTYSHYLRDDTFDGYEIMMVKWKGVGWDTGGWMLHRDPEHWMPVPDPPLPVQE